MSTEITRRTRKRLATRQAISDVATRLFIEKGFDHVTIDDIAEAADVGRKTVFNHFARKEDMFFDLDGQGRRDLEDAVKSRQSGAGLVETLRLFAHRSALAGRPYIRFFPGSQKFVSAVIASEALTARARAIREELTDVLANALSEAAGRPAGDPAANLFAALFVTTWVVAAMEGHRVFGERGDAEEATAAFLAMIDLGTRGLKVAMESTPYG